MAVSRTQILESLLQQLEHCERRVARLIASNEACTEATRAQIDDTIDHLTAARLREARRFLRRRGDGHGAE